MKPLCEVVNVPLRLEELHFFYEICNALSYLENRHEGHYYTYLRDYLGTQIKNTEDENEKTSCHIQQQEKKAK